MEFCLPIAPYNNQFTFLDGVAGGSKPATLDTGAVVNVPLFIDRGEEIMVDTRTGQYMSRA